MYTSIFRLALILDPFHLDVKYIYVFCNQCKYETFDGLSNLDEDNVN